MKATQVQSGFVDPNKVPFYILNDLRERGVSDDRLKRMTPRDAFLEYCNWHGLVGWGGQLWEVVASRKDSANG